MEGGVLDGVLCGTRETGSSCSTFLVTGWEYIKMINSKCFISELFIFNPVIYLVF